MNIKEDSKSFWKYIRSKSKIKTGVGDLEGSDGSLYSSNKDKAEILNCYFSSVFTEEDSECIPTLEDRVFNNELTDIVVTPQNVEKALLNLNTSKSPGDDMLHPLVLKEARSVLSTVLSSLFNKSFTEGKLPAKWKHAVVVPLFKKGKKQKAENYRPVSLTSIVCKVFERIIRDELVNHMESNELFTKQQHGFRQKHSCVTQLLEVTDDWYNILDEGGNIDSIYLDFRKAFDTVPHKRLKNKINSYGIRGRLLTWIVDFLSQRTQSVKVGNQVSSKTAVTSGIPQGSVLGPVLFLVFINDITSVVNCVVKLFADDTKLYSEITSPEDCEAVQQDLDNLSSWSDTWLLRFNAAKCKSLHLGKNNQKHEYKLTENGVDIKIEQVCEEKDIGVIFDSELKFNKHITSSVNRANQKLGMIRRSFEYMDRDMFVTLYKSLIRPLLEYATVIWSPLFKKDIVAIENIQRRATKLISGIRELPYEERLINLGLPTLAYRRERADMIQLFKIMNNFDSVELKSLKLAEQSTTRGHEHKLEKRQYKYKYCMNNFVARSINNWNELPHNCIQAKTVNSFKTHLNNAWKHKTNKFQYDNK